MQGDQYQLTELSVTSATGPEGVIYRGVPKVFAVEVTVPKGYPGDITVRVVNDGHAVGDEIDFCGMAVIRSGTNLPCLEMVNDFSVDVPTVPGWVGCVRLAAVCGRSEKSGFHF